MTSGGITKEPERREEKALILKKVKQQLIDNFPKSSKTKQDEMLSIARSILASTRQKDSDF